MSGRMAMAFSSRRLPMKHHGHTTSENTSTVSGEVVMVGSCIGVNLCTTGSRRNRLGYAGEQAFHAVVGFEHRERHRRVEAVGLAVEPGQVAGQRAADAPDESVRIAKPGVREGEQDRAV